MIMEMINPMNIGKDARMMMYIVKEITYSNTYRISVVDYVTFIVGRYYFGSIDFFLIRVVFVFASNGFKCLKN